MRKSHIKPAQLDLFGLSQNGNLVATPQWQSLPTGARHKITGLVARLLMEYDRSYQAKDVHQNREKGDV